MHDVHIRTSGGYRVEARAGEHVTVMDEPAASGGTNAGSTPMEVLLGSLGGCTAITLKMYSGRKGWPLDDVQVHLHLEPAKPGDKDSLPKITQTVTLEGDLDDEQRERLRQIAGRCPVHRLMEGATEFVERLA